MTKKDAVKILEMFLHKQCDLKRTEFAYSDSEVFNAVKMSKEALEKLTIPKKVKRVPHISIHTKKPFVFTYHCPVCNAIVNKKRPSWLFFKESENHCYRCGQALDWRKNEKM